MGSFPLPRQIRNAAGAIRTVGVELEFAGVELEEIGQIVIDAYGGELQPVSPFEYRVVDTALGNFTIEIDLAILKQRSYLKLLDFVGVALEPESLRQAEDILARIASTLIPHEVASPPLPMTELGRLEELRARLQKTHARGTKASPQYAFGLQFNPEVPSLDAATILNYLRAFLLLADWLERQAQIALSRRLSTFINSFPQLYVRQVLQPDYAPDLDRLIADYIQANPTRNRPLDLLPVFAYLAPEQVQRSLHAAKVKINPRPTFHYRLPNSLIDDAAWTLAQEWRGWIAVDNLAQVPEQFAQMSADYLSQRGQLVVGYDEHWAERVAHEWLQAITDPSLV